MTDKVRGCWNRYKVLNAINNKYNLSPLEITDRDEAEEFSTRYIGPLADMSPEFFDQRDADICSIIADNWGDPIALWGAVVPLLEDTELSRFHKT